MPEGIDLGLSGLASNFDWRSLVDQLSEVERAPQRRLRTEQTALEQRNNAYASINTQLSVLQSRVATLKDGDLFDARAVTVSDTTVGTAAVSDGAPLGSHVFAITQLAAAAVRLGTLDAGQALSPSSDVSGLTLSGAAFATTITDGTFTVNGKQVSITTSDTLQDVFDRISSATSGDIAGSYDPNTDKISLASIGGSEIVLGSATDTSNFLSAAKLANNGGTATASTAALGAIRLTAALDAANFATTINDGGSNAGLFKINGVEISFDADADSLAAVIERINDSAAGVTASYDPLNDRLKLTNKTTGDLGVGLEDVTGNFLAATGLSGGTLQRGKDLLYTVNGGTALSSHSNTITEASSGLAGLSVTALKEGASVTVGVAADTATIKSAITDFVTEYNRVQSLIESSTASTTDAKGVVTAGILASESDAYTLASQLRNLATTQVSGLSGVFKQLEAIGISSNGNDNTLAVASDGDLEEALSGNLNSLKELFTHSTLGLGVQLDTFLEATIGDEGSLISRQDNLDKQSLSIDTQIVDQEKLVQSHRAQLITSFLAMETAQSRVNQQLSFLSQRFGGTSS